MEHIKEVAYKRYQLRWMMDHGYSLADLVERLYQTQYSDPEDCGSISTPVTELFEQWELESGFDGELWECYEEFLSEEYQDAGYMETLLDGQEYETYLQDVQVVE